MKIFSLLFEFDFDFELDNYYVRTLLFYAQHFIRRRIYDIVNVLESVDVVVRRAKNLYTWHGLSKIPVALERIKQGKFNGAPNSLGTSTSASTSSDPNNNNNNNNNNSLNTELMMKTAAAAATMTSSGQSDGRREKSLGLLSQRFLHLFLNGEPQGESGIPAHGYGNDSSVCVSLEGAAKKLLGGTKQTKTKVRRLYDIANILSSLNLIEKQGNSVYKWLGHQAGNVKLRKPVVRQPSQYDVNAFMTKTQSSGSIYTSLEGKENQNQGQINKKMKMSHSAPKLEACAAALPPTFNARQQQPIQQVQNLAELTPSASYVINYQNDKVHHIFSNYLNSWKIWHLQQQAQK